MMKKHLFFLLSVGVLIPAALCAQQKTALRLSGIAEGTTQGKVYLQKYIDRYYQVIDSATIGSDGTFRFANVVELPEIYGLSFSLSDTPFLVFLDEGDITVRLNPQDGLPYHHASELKYWNSDIARLYGIRAIPANLLLDKDGRIVAKNLRGGDLADTLHRLTAGE